MKSCNFDYLYNTPNIEDIENFIIKLKNKYSEDLKNIELLNNKILLNYNKEQYILLINKHKQIILSLIKDIINFFPQLSYIPHIVFLQGSFAKELNRMNSDIDLNILYPSNFKKDILPIEEIISIILQKIIGYRGRDKIHNMMLYTYNEPINDILESTVECTISFPSNQIYKYHCRPNFDEIMYKIKNSSRDYEVFINYIRSNITSSKCFDWCYSCEQIVTNCKFYNINKDLSMIENDNVDKTNLNNYNKLIEELKNNIYKYNFDINKDNTISEINHNLKINNLRFIYNTLALIRRFLFINGKTVNGLNFFELFDNKEFIKLFSNEELENIKDSIFKYLWQLSRIENLFKINNVNFSSRNYDSYSFKLLNQLYNDLYTENLNNIQNESTDNFHKSLEKVLTRIKI